jgi:hypothetical protein
MYKLTGLLMAVAILCSYNSAKVNSMKTLENTLSENEKNDGWVTLFDGKTTNGWHSYGKDKAGSDWKVVDGSITLEPVKEGEKKDGGDLVTDSEYSNFDFKIDWKISPKGNSGIIFYIHEDPSLYHETYNTGLEMQVLDNGTPTRLGHSDGKLYTHRAGDLYDLLASKEAVHPQGEWNHVEIISLNGKLDFYMNGVHTLSTHLWDKNWQQMVGISKFKDMKNFGIFKQGKISLQDHGDKVWYKNIMIKKL